MLKEKVTVELPKGIADWFRLKAEFYRKTLEEQLAEELIEDCHADVSNIELVGEVVGFKVLTETGIDMDLYHLGKTVDWIKEWWDKAEKANEEDEREN